MKSLLGFVHKLLGKGGCCGGKGQCGCKEGGEKKEGGCGSGGCGCSK